MGTIRQLKPNAFPPPHKMNNNSSSTATPNVLHATTTRTTTETTINSTAPTKRLEHNNNNKTMNNNEHCTTRTKSTTTTTTTRSTSARLSRTAAVSASQLRNTHIWRLLLTLTLSMCGATMANPVFVDNPSLAQFQSGRNIRHLPCIVRKSGHSGICMFAIDCIKQNGTHLGTCIDRFYFGSCCQLKDETALYAPEISDNSIDQNTISHFAHHESPTTLPSSALFKLTTEPLLHIHSSSHRIPLHNTTATAAHKPESSASISSSSSISSSKKPSSQLSLSTPTKISQFVVRTSAKPTVQPTTTVKPTRRKGPTTSTTTAAPILTTQSLAKIPPTALEQRVEMTTGMPTKFFTFQLVETTTVPTMVTEEQQFFTTIRPTRRPKPPVVSERPKPKPTHSPRPSITTTTPPPTTTVRSPTRPTPPVRRPSPTHTVTTITTASHQRPSSTASKRPTPAGTNSSSSTTTSSARPTQKPILTTFSDRIRPSVLNTTIHTLAPTKQRPTRPGIINSTNRVDISTAFLESHRSTPKPTITERTTLAPRPKPQPTTEIVKVPHPTVHETQPPVTEIFTVPHKRPTTTQTATSKPSSPTKTSTTESVSSTTKKTTTPITTSTTTSTTTTTTTRRPKPTTAKPLPSSTETPLTTQAPKPGLVTWTDVNAEPVTNATVTDDWQPRPPADWVPVPTIAPEVANKTSSSESQADVSVSSSEEISTEKIIISVSTSVSEIMSNGSIMVPRPTTTHRPSLTTSTTTTKAPRPTQVPTTAAPTTARTTPTTTTTTTTTPRTTTTTPSSTTTRTTTASTTTTTTETFPILIDITTDTPMGGFDWNNATSSESSTEDNNFTGTGSSTIDYSTEDYNATMDMSTTTPQPNLLEGMDFREICGRRMFPEPRIVGGSNAAFGRWPWQISLRQWRTSTYLHKCGAALLNENWAITAAHCVDNVPPSDLLLRLGEYDLAEEEEPYGYQERRVQIVASHPQFDPRTFEYDLALLRFYEPVVFQPNIIPVCVPNSDLDFIGQTAFVTGWGRLYEDGPLPSVLQEVAVPVINNTICETMYRTAGYIEHIPHIFICAGWKKGGYDSCEGDSGGPMVLQREDDKRFQLGGVISWGIGCAEANQPGVYTRISEFRDWINQILQF